MNTPVRIAIVGGGFAGLESAFLLRSRLGARADLTLISNTESFLFKPNTIYIPLGGDPESLLIPLARPTSKRDIRLVRGSAASIDPDRRRLAVNGRHLGEHVRYDFLVVASGAGRPRLRLPAAQAGATRPRDQAAHRQTQTPSTDPTSARDCTGHAETNLDPEFLTRCTLYTSTEPCAMCAGAIYWGNVRRVALEKSSRGETTRST